MTTTKPPLTLAECKDEVAKKWGWRDWKDLESDFGNKPPQRITDPAAELYKTSALEAYKKELRVRIDEKIKECKNNARILNVADNTNANLWVAAEGAFLKAKELICFNEGI